MSDQRYVDATVKQAAEYISKLHTQQQRDIQMDSWKARLGEMFVQKVESELRRK